MDGISGTQGMKLVFQDCFTEFLPHDSGIPHLHPQNLVQPIVFIGNKFSRESLSEVQYNSLVQRQIQMNDASRVAMARRGQIFHCSLFNWKIFSQNIPNGSMKILGQCRTSFFHATVNPSKSANSPSNSFRRETLEKNFS